MMIITKAYESSFFKVLQQKCSMQTQLKIKNKKIKKYSVGLCAVLNLSATEQIIPVAEQSPHVRGERNPIRDKIAEPNERKCPLKN